MAAGYDLPMRDQVVELHAKYTALVERLKKGEVLADAPWTDPRFQKMISQAFGDRAADARKLADMEAGGRHLRALLGL